MKLFKFFASLAIVFAVSSAFVTKARDNNFLKNGYRQDASACTLVSNVPNNCTTASGTSCGFYNAQGTPSTTCVDILSHP